MYKITSVCKGGGYMYCRTDPKHPKANSKGLYPLHRVMMENKLGRSLYDDEDVHHKDENKFNNTPENLINLTKSEHTKLHSVPARMITATCSCCSKKFEVLERYYNLRVKRNKFNQIFCSRSCGNIKIISE